MRAIVAAVRHDRWSESAVSIVKNWRGRESHQAAPALADDESETIETCSPTRFSAAAV